MKHVLFDLRFILRNWRYLHFHKALWSELRDWWLDYEPQSKPKVTVDYSINVNGFEPGSWTSGGGEPHFHKGSRERCYCDVTAPVGTSGRDQ